MICVCAVATKTHPGDDENDDADDEASDATPAPKAKVNPPKKKEQAEFNRRSDAAKRGAKKRADNAAAKLAATKAIPKKTAPTVNDVSVKKASSKVISHWCYRICSD